MFFVSLAPVLAEWTTIHGCKGYSGSVTAALHCAISTTRSHAEGRTPTPNAVATYSANAIAACTLFEHVTGTAINMACMPTARLL